MSEQTMLLDDVPLVLNGHEVRAIEGGFTDGKTEYRTFSEWRRWHKRVVRRGSHASFWYEGKAYFACRDTDKDQPFRKKGAGHWTGWLDIDEIPDYTGETFW